MKGAKNLLIYRNCSLGDFIVGIPSYKIIKDLNKNHKILLVSGKLIDKKNPLYF